MTLNFKHRLFLKHLFDGAKDDPVKAASLAGYTNPKQAAARLLANRTIATYVEQKLESAGAMGISEIVARWSDAASFDPTEFLIFTEEEKNGKTVEKVTYDVKKLKRRGLGYLIKHMDLKPGGGIDIEFHNSMEATDKLAKYYGMFVQKVEVDYVGDVGTERVAAFINTLVQLKGVLGSPEDRGEPESRTLCVDFKRIPMEAGETSGIPDAEDDGCGGGPH